MSNKRALRKNILSAALGGCLLSLMPVGATLAASNDGALIGRTASGTTVVATNLENGLERTVTADEKGNYRFPFLPVGTYRIEVRKDGQVVQKAEQVRISLGNATRLNIGAESGVIDTVQVRGTAVVSPIDVSSVESASNFTAEEIQRLPVERDAGAVALLTPGVGKGDKDLGGFSFGGSSVAENTVFINGLNVTDFSNRIGNSAVPYAFYKEFQVKTGGYSVEFGRTTGGVINAVTKSGSNEFKYGAEVVWEPSFMQTAGTDRYDTDGNLAYSFSRDKSTDTNLNLYASGAIVQDKLFFYGLYEARNFSGQTLTGDAGEQYTPQADDAFWGVKLDWHVNDKNLVELLAFSDKNTEESRQYEYDLDTGRGDYLNTAYTYSGGTNWALTWTSYLTENLSGKFLYGRNERDRTRNSLNDINCNYIRDRHNLDYGRYPGCTSEDQVLAHVDEREAMRMDFEWNLDRHLVRFGLDRENNVSDYREYNPGPGGIAYTIRDTDPGTQLTNGGIVPAGIFGVVSANLYEVSGQFETVNSAFYVEDNWSVTDNLVLNLGLRSEAFDNKDAEGNSFIKMDNMLAPRFGFSWDMNGDSSLKIFGNVGRYFLPVANVINVKLAGGLLSQTTYYAFEEEWDSFTYNGSTYYKPVLGAQIGPVDNTYGDGSVGDLRGKVDSDLDPVFQDELILGFQKQIDDKWSWGVRGTYRKLNNAIEDITLTANSTCDGFEQVVMANPGKVLTVYTDTDCDGVNDGFDTIDTSTEGWALYDDNGDYVGQRGWDKPKRSYSSLEFVLDRAWDDKWSFNGSYTLAFSKGNYEGPANSDLPSGDQTGRTYAFDNPYVNLNGYGYLPNDRRHTLKLRGSYAFNDNWSVGSSMTVQSGRPINGFGAGNPFDGTDLYSFYQCVQNCEDDPSQRVYVLNKRGAFGRTPWTVDLNASVTYERKIGDGDFRANLAIYNLLNMERVTQVSETLQYYIGDDEPEFARGTAWQKPRYAQLTMSIDF